MLLKGHLKNRNLIFIKAFNVQSFDSFFFFLRVSHPPVSFEVAQEPVFALFVYLLFTVLSASFSNFFRVLI